MLNEEIYALFPVKESIRAFPCSRSKRWLMVIQCNLTECNNSITNYNCLWFNCLLQNFRTCSNK